MGKFYEFTPRQIYEAQYRHEGRSGGMKLDNWVKKQRELDACIAEHLFGFDWYTTSCSRPYAVALVPNNQKRYYDWRKLEGNRHKYALAFYWGNLVPNFENEPDLVIKGLESLFPKATIKVVKKEESYTASISINKKDKFEASADSEGTAVALMAAKVIIGKKKWLEKKKNAKVAVKVVAKVAKKVVKKVAKKKV